MSTAKEKLLRAHLTDKERVHEGATTRGKKADLSRAHGIAHESGNANHEHPERGSLAERIAEAK